MYYMLKAELHSHSKEDIEDKLNYGLIELIDRAAELKFDVLGVTFHHQVIEGKFLEKHKKYALSKGILLIAGCEARFEGCDVIIYGISERERKKVKSLEGLYSLKKHLESEGRTVVIIAPHPYFQVCGIGAKALGRKLAEYKDMFDLIEVHMFYTRWFNLNRKAIKFARHTGKHLVGNGDIHNLSMLGHTYTLIDSKRTEDSVLDALKNGKVLVKTRPLPTSYFFSTILRMLFNR